MSTRLSSLKTRLLFALMMVLVVVGVTLWAGIHWSTEREASRDLNRRLVQTAILLQVTLQDHSDRDAASLPWLTVRTGSAGEPAWRVPPSFEVVTRDDRVVMRSPDFPEVLRKAAPGFESRDVQGLEWRVFTQADDRRGVTYRVAISQTVSEVRGEELQRRFTQPLLWALPVFLLAALVAVRQSLAPLGRLERAVARQDASNPGPLDIERRHVPGELRALVARLDRLLQQMSDVLVRQRAFIAAAGHELRTPLAGLKAQLGVARRSRESEQRGRALAKAEHSIDRMTGLVEQLLLLAKSDGQAPLGAKTRLDLAALVKGLVAEYREKARQAGMTLVFESLPESIRLRGDAALLESMVANLLDNALRFAPVGSEIAVLLAAGEHQVEIRVRDQGPGIPEQERRHAFDPFYRCNGEPGSGSGLGLTIVQAIARLHQGQAVLQEAPEGGNEAVIMLPMST